MFSGENPAAVSIHPSFGAVLDAACERLMEWQVEYSIQRINEMEGRLAAMERELDMFLQSR